MEEHAYLTLGCYGRKENGFILCPSTENRILKLADYLVDFDKIMDYLDALKLFDRPLLDQNAINHLVFNIQEMFSQKIRPIWTDHEFHLIERFMQMHKHCGLYSQIILTNEENLKEIEEKPIFIASSKETPKKQPIFNLPNRHGRKM